MPTRGHVHALLDAGHSYEEAGRLLGVSAGQAYMIATGLPADGGGVPAPEEIERKRVLPGGSQHLVNPPPVNPKRDERILAWVRERAARELDQTASRSG